MNKNRNSKIVQYFAKTTYSTMPQLTAPAPWQLTGQGYILLYKFPKWFVEKHGFLSQYQAQTFSGYFGTVMLVDYESSGVGPYQELLFIAGMFDIADKNRFSISKIYVSSQDSVDNGIRNWGIPKEKANFSWETVDKNTEKIVVSNNGAVFFEATFQKKWLKFPLTTALTPLNVAQKLGNDLMITKPTAKGQGQWAAIKSLKVDAKFFPDLSLVKPIAVIATNDFKMVFPVPEIKESYF